MSRDCRYFEKSNMEEKPGERDQERRRKMGGEPMGIGTARRIAAIVWAKVRWPGVLL